MSDVAIRVENLGKQYRIGGPQARYKTIRESLTETMQSPFRRLSAVVRGQSSAVSNETIWALKNVSFEVKRGEVVGIIGRNGAGKTTLLKILSRITEPTEGYAEIHGRVGSLLEVGTGFHPELTGRENIYLNGAILGMKRAEIDRKFDEIVDFAEIEKFLDTPVKRYSSGMYVRLAFAVAAHLEPEILLVDEVLAVGDAAFQKKCLGKMGDVSREGRTVLFVSHNMAAVQSLCSYAIVLDGGSVRCNAPTNRAVETYLRSMEMNLSLDLKGRFEHSCAPLAHYTEVYIRSENGERVTTAISGQPVDIVLAYQAKETDLELEFSLGIYNSMGEKLLHLGTVYMTQQVVRFPKVGQVVCQIPKLPLPAGRHTINVSLRCRGEPLDHVASAVALNVEDGDFFGTGKTLSGSESKILLEHNWLFPEEAKLSDERSQRRP